MMRLMRADIYRILRGKAIYITFAVMVAIVILTVFVVRRPMEVVTVTVTEDELPGMQIAAEVMSGSVAAQMALDAMDTLQFYAFIVAIVAVAMSAFSSGAIKNELSVGISRAKLYLSKLILSAMLCLAFMFGWMALSILLAITIDGPGYWSGDFLWGIAKSFGMQTFFMLALNSIGMFFCFTFKRTAATIGAYVALIFVPMMVVSLLVIAFPSAIDYLFYDLASQISIFARTSTIPGAYFARGVAVGMAWLLMPTIAGIMLFKKAEIK